MTRRVLFLGCLVVLSLGWALGWVDSAAANPFLTRPESGGARESGPSFERLVAPTLPGRMGTRLVEWQRDLNRRLTTFLRETSRDGLSPRALALILGASFLYGALHAVLPGHRKTVIVSYFLYEPASIRAGIGAGFLFAGLHAVSAVGVVLIVYLVLETAGAATMQRVSLQLQIASSVLIMIVGIVFFGIKIRSTARSRRDAAALRMGQAVGFDHRERLARHVPRVAPQRLTPILIATGMVPCPVTTLVVLFTLSFGILTTGLISAAAISVGLGVALSAIAALTIVLKERFVSLLQRRWGTVVQFAVEISAAALLVGFGLVTLLAVL